MDYNQLASLSLLSFRIFFLQLQPASGYDGINKEHEVKMTSNSSDSLISIERRMISTSVEHVTDLTNGRLFSVDVNNDLTINLLPFILFVKLAFILGLFLKEPLFGSMEEYITTNMYANHDSSSYGLSGYQGATPAVNFVSPSTYYGDPTRVFDSSEGEELVGTRAVIPSNEKTGSEGIGVFQLAKDIGVVLVSYMMGLDEEDYYNPTPLHSGAERKDDDSSQLNVVSPIMENQYSGGFAYSGDHFNVGQTPKHFRGLGVQKPSNIHLQPLPPLDPGQYLTSSPTLPPAHYVTTNSPENLQNLEYNNGLGVSSTARPSPTYLHEYEQLHYNTPNLIQNTPSPTPSLSFDPSTKTLFIDSSSAQMLNLQDGDVIPLPDHILEQAIDQGQVDILESAIGFPTRGNTNRDQIRFPNPTNNRQDSYASPMQEYAPINNILVTDVNAYGLVQGRNSNGEFRVSEGSTNAGLPSKYHNMIYRAYHGGDTTGGRLSPLDDDFHASNKEEDFLVAPPLKEWLPVNRPSGYRAK